MSDTERALREVVDLVPDVLFRCYKGDDGYIYWSLNEGGLAREFHLTTEEIRGRRLEDLFPGGASEAVRDHFYGAFEGRTEPFVNEIEGRFFKHFPQPVHDDEGRVVEVVGFISEVTELVEVERRLRQANDDLDAFAHSASHDLRVPLTVLRNLLEIGRTQAHASEWHARMEATVERMGAMIDALLTFSRSGSAALRAEVLDVSKIAGDAAALLAAQEPARHVRWDIQPGLRARGDAAMMRVIMDNLLGNAWKFTRGRHNGRIRVRSDGDAIVVEDNGTGIPVGDEQRVFEPFYRGPSGVPGHGIGLATVRRIVERHGGHIEAQNRAGDGACFRLRLEAP